MQILMRVYEMDDEIASPTIFFNVELGAMVMDLNGNKI